MLQLIRNVNKQFNRSYDKFILPKYITTFSPILEPDIAKEYTEWKIPNREYILKQCITIDSHGCKGVDDGFSIYYMDNRLYLSIHIADPTCYLDPRSVTFDKICSNGVTRYPSSHKPIHLLPTKIVESASLSTNDVDKIKKAVTITTEIDEKTFNPINKPKLNYTYINVSKHTKLTYYEAAQLYKKFDNKQIDTYINKNNKLRALYTYWEKCAAIMAAYKISLQMKVKRDIIGKKIEHIRSNIKYIHNKPILYNDTENTKSMKSMIAEFAIFANSFIGEYLIKNSQNDTRYLWIYRVFNASELKTSKKDTGDKVLDNIIKSKISPTYTQDDEDHDLVGSTRYIHFTSPIRRASDCICHFILKYIHLKRINPVLLQPFTEDRFAILTKQTDQIIKINRKLQYKDVKFRTIQALCNIILQNKNAIVGLKFENQTGNYLNFKIKKINQFDVSLSYTLKMVEYPENAVMFLSSFGDELININVGSANIPRKYDDGILPDVNRYLENLPNLLK